jgi:hypothetical protein
VSHGVAIPSRQRGADPKAGPAAAPFFDASNHANATTLGATRDGMSFLLKFAKRPRTW